ncbi:MAG: Gfo/Idh/MocA family protein [Puniceicoccaceae bacterium]
MSKDSNYALGGDNGKKQLADPDLNFRPPWPKSYQAKIGLIGCGGITEYHLKAYKAKGLEVVALCDLDRSKMEERQKEFFPDAVLYDDYHKILANGDIGVVDIALHPEPRYGVVEAALKAGKHVLSQKPFVLDLDKGQALVELAGEHNLKLAVNQNGRWAPYVRYTAEAIKAGLIGDIQSVSIRMNWDHTWVKGTAFESIHHLILYDFAIHWVDMVRLFMGNRKELSAFAQITSTRDQEIGVPMVANISFGFENAIANLMFDGHSKAGAGEDVIVVGSKGTIRCSGEVCKAHKLSLVTDEGEYSPTLEGEWFHEGFVGTMGELLCAIEEDREPENSARQNLESLKLAFAAIASADSGQPVTPGEARRLGESCKPKA